MALCTLVPVTVNFIVNLNHDWPWWQKQLPYFMGHILGPAWWPRYIRISRLLLVDHGLYTITEHLHRRREDLVFFPDQISGVFYSGDDRPKAQGTVPGCVDQLIKADGIAKAVFYKQGGIIHQVVGGHDIHRGQVCQTCPIRSGTPWDNSRQSL